MVEQARWELPRAAECVHESLTGGACQSFIGYHSMLQDSAKALGDAVQDHVPASCDGHQFQNVGGQRRTQRSVLRSKLRPPAAKLSAKGQASKGALPARSAPAEQAASDAPQPLSYMQPPVLHAPYQIASRLATTSSATGTAACQEAAQLLSATLPASGDPLPRQHHVLHAVSCQNLQQEPTIKTYRTRRASKRLANTSQAQQQPTSADPSGGVVGQDMAAQKSSSKSRFLAARTSAAPSSVPAGRSQQENPLRAASMAVALPDGHGQQPLVQQPAAATQAAGQDQAEPLHGDAMQTCPEQRQPGLKTYKTRIARQSVGARVPLPAPKGVEQGQQLGSFGCPSSGQNAQDGIDASSQDAAPQRHQQPLQGGIDLPSQVAAPQAHQQPLQAPGQAQTREQTQAQRALLHPPLPMQPPLKTYRTRAARAKAAATPGHEAAAATCPALPSSPHQPQQAGFTPSVGGRPEHEVQHSSGNAIIRASVNPADSKPLSFIMSLRMLAETSLCKLGMREAQPKLQAHPVVHLESPQMHFAI